MTESLATRVRRQHPDAGSTGPAMGTLVRAVTVLSTGLLAGAFGYGAANLVPTFGSVPLDMRLSFHSELMKMNGVTMQATMAVAALSAITLAATTRGWSRRLAAAAGTLVVMSFLVTRFGNVPINGHIKQWAVGGPPAGYAEILQRWEMFNIGRTAAAIVAFALVVHLVTTRGKAATAAR